MHGISLKVEIIASKSTVFRAVQARTKPNAHTMTKTHTRKRKRTYHPVVAMHSRRYLHIKAIITRIKLAYFYSILYLKKKTGRKLKNILALRA